MKISSLLRQLWTSIWFIPYLINLLFNIRFFSIIHLKYNIFYFLGLRYFHFYAPAMTMAGTLSATPVCPLYVHQYVTPNNVRYLSWIVLVRNFWNFVNLLSTIMSSSSSIMVHIAPCLQELLPFAYENSTYCCIWNNDTLLRWIVLVRILCWSHWLVLKCLLKVRDWSIHVSHYAYRSYCPLFMKIHCLCKFCNSGVSMSHRPSRLISSFYNDCPYGLGRRDREGC